MEPQNSASLLPTAERLAQIPDSVTAARIMRLHPLVRVSAVDSVLDALAAMSGKNKLRVTYSLRTFAEQDALYAKGRDKAGNKIGATVTNAKGGQSYHNYGLALDFVLMHPDGKVSYSLTEDLDADGVHDWDEVARAFKAHGWEWGGEWNTFKDNPHVQLTFGHNWRELLKLRNGGKVDEAGYVVIPGIPATGATA